MPGLVPGLFLHRFSPGRPYGCPNKSGHDDMGRDFLPLLPKVGDARKRAVRLSNGLTREPARRGSLSVPALPAGYRSGRQFVAPPAGTRAGKGTDE